MISKEILITNKKGIHARPAALIVEAANKFVSDIFFIKDGARGNAKSIMNILLLALEPDTKIIIEAQGPDEREAVQKVGKLFESDFKHEPPGQI